MTPILDPNDRDSHLVWPPDVTVAELRRRLRVYNTGGSQLYGVPAPYARPSFQGVERVLGEAFAGNTVVEQYLQHDFDQAAWLGQLIGEVPQMPMARGAAPFWSARQGRPAPTPLTVEATMDRFVTLVNAFDWDGLFAQSFGVDCPDGVLDPHESPDAQIEDRIGYAIGESRTWPLQQSRSLWGLDQFFDLIEVLHDLASWPGTWHAHNYGGCVGHPGDYSSACGQGLYRYKVNQLLDRSELDFRLSDYGEDQGRIVRAVDDGTEMVVAEAQAHQGDPHQGDVDQAIALFRSRNSDVSGMRSAVVALAGVLEAERALLKTELLSKDSDALFIIANKFDLRHRKVDQHTDYSPAFLQWLFNWYLSTINLVRKLKSETQPQPE